MNPNQHLSSRLHSLLACVLFSLPISLAQALPTDKEQPTHIKADSASLNQKQGLQIYTGNVKLTQGSLEITADKITFHLHSNQKPESAVAEGNPARYQVQPDADKSVIHAEAGIIDYNIGKQHVTLEKNAYVEQNGATTKGGRIDYDMNSSTIKASGNGGQSGQVELVIPPQTDKKE